jgi:hypothetical protein
VSTCRLCRTADAKINFTSDLGVIDVDCEKCGRFRVEITGYNQRFDSLSGSQRLRVLEFVTGRHEHAEVSPLISAEFLKQVVSAESPSRRPGPTGRGRGAAWITHSMSMAELSPAPPWTSPDPRRME